MQYIFLDQDFPHPFFLTYFSTTLFSLYLFGFAFSKKWRNARGHVEWTPVPTEEISQADDHEVISSEAHLIEQEENIQGAEAQILSAKQVMKISLLFCPVWFIANYAYNSSLVLTTVASNTILSATSGFFTLLFGTLFRVEEFSWGKLLATTICIAGVALVTLVDTQQGTASIIGDVVAMGSAVFYGLYVSLLRKKVRNEQQVPMPMFFGFVGFFNCIMLWPFMILLHYTGVESFEFPPTTVLLYLFVNGLIGTVLSDLLWSYAIFYTSPTVATVGLSLTIPLAIIFELFMNKRTFSVNYFLGSALVLFAFLVVNITTREKEKRLIARVKTACCKSRDPLD
jgi:solute carrier family 35 protein F5